MKRLISLILSGTLLLSLCGCANSGVGSINDTEKSETVLAAEQIAKKYLEMDLEKINDGKDITISVHLGDIMPTLSETPTEEQPEVFNSTRILADAFQMIYPNVTIEWARTVDTSSTDGFLQYMTSRISSGTAPDIVSAWGSTFASRGWYYDFNEVLDEPNRFIEENEKWKDQIPEYLFNAWQVSDGLDRVVAMPLSLAAGTSTAIYYNSDLLTSLNLEVPTKWSELFTVGKALSDAGYVPYSPWGAPGSGNRKVSTTLWDVQYSLGPYYSAALGEKVDYNGDGMQSMSESFRASYEGHYFISDNDYAKDLWKQVKAKYTECLEEGYENTDYESKWLIGKVGLLEDGLWRLPSELSNTERQFEFSIAPPVAIDRDSSSYVGDLVYTEKGPYHPEPRGTYNIVMPSVEAHGGDGCLEACVAFLQFLMVPENNEMIISEMGGKAIGFLEESKVPQQLVEYFNQPFPKTPNYSWPSGFTSEGSAKMSAILELWVKGQITDNEFYKQFDAEFVKDIEDYAKQMNIDTSGYNKGF